MQKIALCSILLLSLPLYSSEDSFRILSGGDSTLAEAKSKNDSLYIALKYYGSDHHHSTLNISDQAEEEVEKAYKKLDGRNKKANNKTSRNCTADTLARHNTGALKKADSNKRIINPFNVIAPDFSSGKLLGKRRIPTPLYQGDRCPHFLHSDTAHHAAANLQRNQSKTPSANQIALTCQALGSLMTK